MDDRIWVILKKGIRAIAIEDVALRLGIGALVIDRRVRMSIAYYSQERSQSSKIICFSRCNEQQCFTRVGR